MFCPHKRDVADAKRGRGAERSPAKSTYPSCAAYRCYTTSGARALCTALTVVEHFGLTMSLRLALVVIVCLAATWKPQHVAKIAIPDFAHRD